MGANVNLTPALERFARELVAEGRYNNVSEVVRQGLRMLQDAEERRRQFTQTLINAEAEADRLGTFSVEEVFDEIEREISGVQEE